jgi:hypothetical protein
MGDVYEFAKRVIIWFGKSKDGTDALLKRMRRMGPFLRLFRFKKLPLGVQLAFVNHLSKLLHRGIPNECSLVLVY